jgi:SAM-dependent methyltransferase
MNTKQFWNNIYESKKEKKPTYDLWLDNYKHIFMKSKEQQIIDLGCGAGGDTFYLTERGYKVVACDYSEEALKILNKFIGEVKTIQMDISKTLPFEEESAEIIIADLSLHYFNDETTKNIVNEIKRVLTTNGYLIGRVNSINDLNYGAGKGEEVEKNFYLNRRRI